MERHSAVSRLHKIHMILPHSCPSCSASFVGAAIPEASIQMGWYPKTCNDCKKPNHFSRVQGIYDWHLDLTVAWRCPDCQHEWSR